MTTYVSLSTPGVLLPDAAESFERARTDGRLVGTTLAAHATRTTAQQVAIFTTYYTRDDSGETPLHKPLDRRFWLGQAWYRRKGYAAAAIPGTSNHGNGRTVDWQGIGGYGSATFKTAAAVLADHGWDNTEGRSVNEPWHWTYDATRDKHINDKEDDLMTDAQYKEVMAAVNEAIRIATKTYKEVQVGKEGVQTDGPLASLDRGAYRQAEAAKDAARASLDAVNRLAAEFDAFTDDVPLTPLSKSIIKAATGKDRKPAVQFRDAVSYAQANAYALDAILERLDDFSTRLAALEKRND